MARTTWFLKDEQWKKLEPMLPNTVPGKKGGRPWQDNRLVLEGILWVLQSGARWRDLPERYPSPATCWRRLRLWEDLGIWLDIWRALLAELDEKQYLNWEETFADGSFAPAKKGGSVSVKPSAAKVRSGWWWSTAKVFLLEAHLLRRRRRKSS
jgi:transposase